MLRIALGQSKMGSKPIAAILHLIVYVGFIIINIELLEIILDGLLGTHRLFAPYLGNLYHILIGTFEILALLVIVAVVCFLDPKKWYPNQALLESGMKGWPN